MQGYKFSEKERQFWEKLQQPCAVYQFVDKRIVTLVISEGFCDMFGYTDREKAYYDMDHNMYMYVHPDDVARVAEAAFRFAANGGNYDVIYRSKLRSSENSEYHIIHSMAKHVFTETGERIAQVWYIDEGVYANDSSEGETKLNRALSTALHEESIVKAAKYDQLTGLPNMSFFFELAESGKKEIEKTGVQTVLMFMDLNGMKFFNSKFGFSEGDKLLQAFAKLLAATFGADRCCHVSGDHFVVFTGATGIEDILYRFFRECKDLHGGDSLPVRTGIYPMGLDEDKISLACDRAKFACDSLRRIFKSSYNYYNKDLREDAERRQYILSNLDNALENRWIQVYYQPIVRAVNGRVCDEEALARWIDPVMGFMSPAFFIPFLEDSGLIYKLDLYILDRVLEKLRYQKESGLNLVPQSINISRSDFDACDIVEEIRKRVDASGFGRDLITVEITESAVGSDFDFMKEQIQRLRDLGFPVWMDDFGSGYSSLEFLQSIKFDLIKFDIIFMRKLEEGEQGKIMLSELMRMATALGVDTVCEGVETESQVRFLQEIGCSKLQGYHFCKPIPLEKIIERYDKGEQIGFENPLENDYYDTVGKVNLYDLSMIASDNDDALSNFFNTIPMGIMEVEDNKIRFVRTNSSYRSFIKRFFGVKLSSFNCEFESIPDEPDTDFINCIRNICEKGGKAFFDEQMPDGSIVHSFIRRLVQNPVNNKTAVAVAVLSVNDPNEGATYASIARALASDYYNIYYVDLKTDQFIEYTSPVGRDELAMERHGENFFESARRDVMVRIYEEDRASFLDSFTKENILDEIDKIGVFTSTYRLIETGKPVYVNMKITRMQPGGDHIIIGISVIDSQMRQHEKLEALQREEAAFVRIMALSGDYLTLYTIDPKNWTYSEYSSTNEFKKFGFAPNGDDFLHSCAEDGKHVVLPEDLPKFVNAMNKDTIMNDIRENGEFKMHYRIMLNGVVRPVTLKIVTINEGETEKLIAGVRLWRDRK